MNSQLIDHLLSAYEEEDLPASIDQGEGGDTLAIDADNAAVFDMIVRGDKRMIASRLAVIDEESDDEGSKHVDASRGERRGARETDRESGLSGLLEEDEDSRFRLSSVVGDEDINDEHIVDVIREIDIFLEEEASKKSVLRYSRAKQLAFDRVEVEYQKMLIVTSSLL